MQKMRVIFWRPKCRVQHKVRSQVSVKFPCCFVRGHFSLFSPGLSFWHKMGWISYNLLPDIYFHCHYFQWSNLNLQYPSRKLLCFPSGSKQQKFWLWKIVTGWVIPNSLQKSFNKWQKWFLAIWGFFSCKCARADCFYLLGSGEGSKSPSISSN